MPTARADDRRGNLRARRALLSLNGKGDSAMEFGSDGAMFLVDIPSVGEEWGVQIPWAVAAEYAGSGGVASPDDEELRAWLQDNQQRFVDMIGARADPDAFPDAERDDPRILATQELRHI